jgi:hypothetical protein
MQPEDSQIDVLLKRYGVHGSTGAPAEHLDADELNAFAERSAPAAARSRYVSHLAECDDCRKLATQLSIAAGATASVGAIETASGSLWQKLTSLFAPPMLRYAAFAAVLVVAVGVTFLALRHQRSSSALVAQNETTAEKQVSAVKPAEPSAPEANQKPQTFASPSATISQPAENSRFDLKKDESKAADTTAAPPKPEKEAAASADQPVFAQKRAAEPVIAKQEQARQQQPSFAPPPPGEAGRVQSNVREERDAQKVAAAPGPRKSEPASDKLKTMDRSAGGISQTRAAEGDDNRARNNQTMANQQTTNQNRVLDSNVEAPKAGGLVMSRSGNEESTEAARKPATSAARRESEKPETRSAGGHKFRRQGDAWVDSKFKSSMSITNVARGSDAFRALDPAVRSMAEQLGGEVIVVSKGKAYRIR